MLGVQTQPVRRDLIQQVERMRPDSIPVILAVKVNRCLSNNIQKPLLIYNPCFLLLAPCHKAADVVFVLDSSTSIGAVRWTKIIEFVQTIVE